MLYYIKKYPVSLLIILTVIYLSFFKPPTTDLSNIPNIDKIVHVCMYLGMSGMLWLEFLRAHQKPLEAARFQAVFCIIQQQGRNLHFCIKFYGFRLANLARVEYNRANDIL